MEVLTGNHHSDRHLEDIFRHDDLNNTDFYEVADSEILREYPFFSESL